MYTKYSERIYKLFTPIYVIIGIIDVLVLFPVLNDFFEFIPMAIPVWVGSAIIITILCIIRLLLDMINELIILHIENNNHKTNNDIEVEENTEN